MESSLISDNKNDYFSKISGIDLNYLINFIDNYLITYRNDIGLKNDTTFGLELEFSNAPFKVINSKLKKLEISGYINKDIDKDFHHYHIWQEKIEKTVWNLNKKKELCGGEIISPIMTDTQEYWKELFTVCNMIKHNKGMINDKTASHIHIGANDISNNPDFLLRLLKIWAAYENIIYRFSMGESIKMRPCYEKYALPIRNIIIENMPKLVEYACNDNNLSLLQTMTNKREYGLNLKNIKLNGDLYKNTIEVRTPNGTLDPILWQNNTLFFTKLIKYVTSDRYNDDIVSHRYNRIINKQEDYHKYDRLDISSALELADLLFDNNLDKTNFLKQYIKEYNTDCAVSLTKKKLFERR